MPGVGDKSSGGNVRSDRDCANVDTRELLFALWWAALSLLASAVVLLVLAAVFIALNSPQSGSGDERPPEITTFSGSELQLRSAALVTVAGSALRVSELGPGDRLLLTAPTRVAAADYPVLEYNIDGSYSGLAIFLIWRTAEQPDRLHNIRLLNRSAAIGTGLMATPDWKGTVVELGLDIYGSLRGGYLTIENISLRPHSLATFLARNISDWRSVEPWSQRSINVLRGRSHATTLSPTVLAALWVVVACLFCCILRWRIAIGWLPVLIIVLSGWLSLDLLWSEKLKFRLDQARALFAGKSQHERRLADMDGDLYGYAVHLKQSLLPTEPKTVFILKEAAGHDFQRLRLQYHLLPHNVYNFGRYPPVNGPDAGDYLIVLGDIPGLGFAAETGLLHWHSGRHLSVQRLDQNRVGTLYRVQGDE